MDVEGRHALLDDDARVRRARQDGRLRDALPRGGRRLRRPGRADGARLDRRRRAAERDQGDGRHARRSAPRCPTRRSRRSSASRRHARRAPRRVGRARAAPTPTQAIRALLAAFPAARDIEISGAGLEEAFLQLTGGEDGSGREPRLPPLRAAADVPEPAVLLLLARLPARPLLPDRRPEPERGRPRATGLSAPLYFMVGLAAFGTMNAMLSAGARIAGERAVGWNRQLRITPLTTRNYFRAKVLTGYADGGDDPRARSTSPGIIARRQPHRAASGCG